MNGATNGTTAGFLSFNKSPPRLHITAEDDEFDETTLQHWRDEGFDVRYLPMKGGGKPYIVTLKALADDLNLGESYGIIAYGDAATVCLEIATKPMPHCAALICYYPSQIPHPNANYPSQLNLVLHLAASQHFAPKFHNYTYAGAEPGFAEHDLDEYDRVAASLAWTRSLGAVRKGFKISVDLEGVREAFSAVSLGRSKDASATVASIMQDGYINNSPTCTGGIGKRALYHFYHDFFLPGYPPSLTTKLISRTVGVDRVVDEMVVSFKHTTVMPWILPEIAPTQKFVEITIVSIIAVRGGKLVSEHIYWDQASVLVQIGALDPNLIPKALSAKGCKKLPIMGADSARKIVNVDKVPTNSLITKW